MHLMHLKMHCEKARIYLHNLYQVQKVQEKVCLNEKNYSGIYTGVQCSAVLYYIFLYRVKKFCTFCT